MENYQIEHKFPEGKPSELIVRTGQAQSIQEPVKVRISGNLDTVRRWIENRVEWIDAPKTHILVSRSNMEITLRENENSPLGSVITGKLEMHPAFEEFGINQGKYRTTTELAEFFKMRRSFFESHSENMKLVSELRNFKAKIDKEIEKTQGTRGDKRLLVNQVVSTNLPESFNLFIPIFKGQNKETIAIELYFNPDDLSCSMVSPDAADMIEQYRDIAINDELENLEDQGIVIIEV